MRTAPRGRSDPVVIRDVAAVALVLGLVFGTVWWQTDDTWPLAQMRMFPGGGESAVAITRIEAELVNGDTKDMNPFAFHLKRAEFEGQMDRIRRDPRMLRDLVEHYNENVDGDHEIVRLRLVRHETHRDGARMTDTEEELVRWPR